MVDSYRISASKRFKISFSWRRILLILGSIILFLPTIHAFANIHQRTMREPPRIQPSSHKRMDYKTSNHLKLFPTDEEISEGQQQSGLSEKDKAVLVLLTVPMAWGTFEPAVRLVYKYQPNIPPFVFSFAYYLAAATALCLLALRSNKQQSQKSLLESQKNEQMETDLPIRGGAELGTYLFLGNALQVIGLKTVPSDRAAFLLQLTTIFVPLVQSILAQNLSIIPVRTWFGCIVALGGVALIGLDGNGSNPHDVTSAFSPENINFSLGDFYIILGAFFYTFHCIRLELYAKTTSAILLAAAKATTETIWSGLVIISCLVAVAVPRLGNPISELAQRSGSNIIDYVTPTSSTLDGHWFVVGLATLWTGLVTVAYTIYAQSYGQSRVPAASANLIYTIQPFFTALVAFIVLGESLGIYGYIGGILIGAAVLLVVVDGDSHKHSS